MQKIIHINRDAQPTGEQIDEDIKRFKRENSQLSLLWMSFKMFLAAIAFLLAMPTIVKWMLL